jgi:hypothetical protein
MITCSIWAGSAFHFAHSRRHLDVVVHQASQGLVDIEDDTIQIEGFGPEHLLAAEREQLSYPCGGTPGGVFDALESARSSRGTEERLSARSV